MGPLRTKFVSRERVRAVPGTIQFRWDRRLTRDRPTIEMLTGVDGTGLQPFRRFRSRAPACLASDLRAMRGPDFQSRISLQLIVRSLSSLTVARHWLQPQLPTSSVELAAALGRPQPSCKHRCRLKVSRPIWAANLLMRSYVLMARKADDDEAPTMIIKAESICAPRVE
jgi:hypothetical protein